MASCDCTLAEVHAELGGRIVESPCRKVGDVVWLGLWVVSLVALWW